MTTTEVRRPPRHPDAPAPPGPPAARRPVVLAAIVLLVWGVWLLVPHDARLALLGGDPDGGAGAPGSGAAAVVIDDPAAVVADDPAADLAGDPAADVAGGTDQDPAADGTDSSGTDIRGTEDRADTADDAGGSDDAGASDDADTADPPASDPDAPDPAPDPAAPGADAVEVPRAGDGTFAVAPGTGAVVGSGDLVRYTVEVEGGVPLDPAQVASVVDRVLADPRSWTAQGRWSLQRVDADPDARIVVASPDTTDRLCAPLRTRGEVSCRNGDDVVLNANRWTRGATSWGDDVPGYQEYVVNHELGHFLGNGHVPCPAPGRPAPVMLQQTIGLDGCEPNAWPYP